MTDGTRPIWLRPERAGVGRPAERTRAEITAAAVTVADRGGAAAVSMRNIADELGTGPASLYRYVSGRDDLLDLMVDATAAEYRLEPPTGDQIRDLVAVAEQTRAIMLHHPWLPELVLTRPALGPYTLAVLEHVLEVLADHPGDGRAKLEIFALLNAITATFALNESAATDRLKHAATYLGHVAAGSGRPRITALWDDLTAPCDDSDDRRTAKLTALISNLLQYGARPEAAERLGP